MNKLFNKIANIWKRMPHWSALLIVLILGVGLGVGIFYGVWNYKLKSRYQLPTPVAQDTNQPPSNVVVPTSTPDFSAQQNFDETFNPKFASQPYAVSATLNLELDQMPRQLTEKEAKELFHNTEIKGYAAKEGLAGQLATSTLVWQVGKIIDDGDFKNTKIFLWKHSQPSEIGGDFTVYNYLIDTYLGDVHKLLLVATDSNLHPYEDSVYFLPAPNIKIVAPPSGLNLKEMALTNGRRIVRGESSFLVSSGGGLYKAEYIQNGKIYLKLAGKTEDGHEIYYNYENCLVIFGADGMVYNYISVIEDLSTIKWNSGLSATSTYVPYSQGGCGFHNCVDVLTDAQVGSVIQAGKTSAGDLIFIPKHPESNNEFKTVYDSAWYAENKPSLEEFARLNPNALFFWKDSFGRWIKYVRTDLQPQAECGKPVIYLYPTKTTSVSVKLPNFIDVTVSDPAYPVRGWNVVAHPDGNLDYADGKTYGSLYWEGTGVNYQTPREGFVIKDGEQKMFLTDTLAKYGLNQKESQEFMDFWLPQMTGSPYYRVSFLTDTWSKAAPLSVWPKPDTNIRIFMDWQKLSAPIKLAEPKITTPARNGFTLVEWGGLLYR